MGAAVPAAQDVTRHRHHVSALLQGAPCGDQRAALLGRFDDDDPERDPGDNTVPQGKVLRERRSAWP